MPVVPQPAPVNPPAPASSSGPVNPTGQIAQSLPGYDPTPAINAQEANLEAYLNQPVQEILARLGLPPQPNAAPPPPGAPPAEPPPGSGNPMDPGQLIKPVTDALGTLGTGMFENLDPTKMFEGISKAFESTAGSMQQAMGALEGVWQGAGGTAAAAKTGETVANGAEVATQAGGLGGSLSTATANVKQAETRLIEIINEFDAKIAAIGPNIIFPWGQAAAIEAANQAISMTTEVITELQSSLAAEAGTTAAIGAPVAVTAAPEMGAGMIGPMVQMATGLMGPAMQAATQGLSQGVGMATGALKTGVETATGLASGLGDAAGAGGPAAGGIPPGAAALTHASAGGGGAGAAGGGSGGGGGLTGAAASRMMAPTTDTTNAAAMQTNVAKPAGAGAGMGMGGAGMMGGAPMGHGGKAGVDGSGHNAAAFLHTSDQGDDIVGDLGSVAPPVIGEVDPNDSPDIELRI